MTFMGNEFEEGLTLEPNRPLKKTVNVEKVSNGYVISTFSNKNHTEKRSIAKTLKEANKMSSKFIGK